MSTADIPGDPGGIARLAARMRAAAADVESVASGASNRGLEASWTGAAGSAFRGSVGHLPGDLGKVVNAFDDAGGVLSTFAGELEEYQRRAHAYAQQIAAAQADLAAARSRQAQAETTLAQAKLRHSLATDPVSLHTLKAAVDVGTGAVQQALAHVEDTSSTVTRLQSWAADNHDEYQSSVNAAADRLDAARRTHSHGLGGWLSSHAKGLLGDVEGGLGTVAHFGGDLLHDGEDLVATDIGEATDFVKGVGDFVVGLKDLGVMAVKLSPAYGLIDPAGQREEEQRLGRGLAYSATHPLDVLESIVDWKDLTNGHPYRALGQLAPNIALVVFTGGGGAAADAADAAADGVGAGALKATTGGIGPVLKGQAGVARAIGEIEAEGGTVLGNGEITIDTPEGRTRIDLVQRTSTGEREFVEVKNGPTASPNANQKRVFEYIRQFGGTPVGQRAAQAGFTPGEPIPPTPVVVRSYK